MKVRERLEAAETISARQTLWFVDKLEGLHLQEWEEEDVVLRRSVELRERLNANRFQLERLA